MTIPDHYATLGVLPAAEGIVITAAYRALAQRYHPDKSSGDPLELHRRMSEINEAYRVLGNEKLRADYDGSRRQDGHADYRSADNEASSEAFASALCELEGRWLVATDIFPDLNTMRGSLEKISNSLAFEFVTILLESKRYKDRANIAATLERRFLERYFGTNATLIVFAKKLITAGQREAAKKLNNLVDVMGSDVDPNLLIQRVEKQYGIRTARAQRQGEFTEQTQAEANAEEMIDTAECKRKLVAIGCRVRSLSIGEWEILHPSGVTSFARSAKALQRIAVLYSGHSSNAA